MMPLSACVQSARQGCSVFRPGRARGSARKTRRWDAWYLALEGEAVPSRACAAACEWSVERKRVHHDIS
jgi:hypothetical protein